MNETKFPNGVVWWQIIAEDEEGNVYQERHAENKGEDILLHEKIKELKEDGYKVKYWEVL